MALSRATVVQRVRYELGDRPWETTGSASSATSVVAVADGTDWAEGDIGEFVEDGDTFWVQSISGNNLTAVRSYWGSTGAAHSSGARILKNPRYTFTEITNAIEAVIQERLWPWAWKKVADTIAPDPASTVWYDLDSTARGLISVRQLYGTNNTKEGRYGTRRGRRVYFRRNMTTTLVTSGVGLRFPDGFFHSSNTVNVDFAAKITDTVASGNYSDLTDGDAVVEAIIYGAVAHLEAALENRKPRKPRHDRETLRGAALYERRFTDALARANQELRATIPILADISDGG